MSRSYNYCHYWKAITNSPTNSTRTLNIVINCGWMASWEANKAWRSCLDYSSRREKPCLVIVSCCSMLSISHKHNPPKEPSSYNNSYNKQLKSLITLWRTRMKLSCNTNKITTDSRMEFSRMKRKKNWSELVFMNYKEKAFG